MEAVAKFVAAGFGVGFLPVAPGTFGSAAAACAGALALWWSPWCLIALAVVITVSGAFAIRHARIEGDPGWVVIDEYAGQCIALVGLAHVSVVGVVLAFLLFRLFDVTKLGPVGWGERQPGTLGVMLDDVIAGAIAAVILILVTRL